MISTDVLSRGIDIEKINLVINYDMAEDSDTYLHRVRVKALPFRSEEQEDLTPRDLLLALSQTTRTWRSLRRSREGSPSR